MVSISDTELFGMVVALYQEKNDYATYQKPDSRDRLTETIHGLQGDLLHYHNVDIVEEVGHPDEVFVTVRDVATLTGYSQDNARRRLDVLVDEGLLIFHGDVPGENTQRLYLPADLPVKEKFAKLHELDGRSIPPQLTDRTSVTPGDFDHAEGGVFVYEENPTIGVDVEAPEDWSIRAYVEDQLSKNDLVATDLDNFCYKLRQKAELIE
ncbi:hypothetical protein [Halorussus aquaticus]|uniref:Uncharacterized protein n=1 Tax=Halorussus aquaticus TaxID=2953748 RepID=A0ABD5Q8G4_9EURY|nr:hypothetical protein [Halorussus aquaticus]